MPKGSVGIEFLNINVPEWKAQVQDMSKFVVDSFTAAEKAAVASSDRVTKSRKKDADQHVKDFQKAESEKQKHAEKTEKYLDGVRARSIAAANKAADAEAKASERAAIAQQKAAERTASLQIKESERAQSAIAKLVQRTRDAQQKALDDAAKGSKSGGYNIFSGVPIAGQTKDDAIKAAIASRTKYEVELEGKKAKEVEKIIADLRKQYNIEQRAMELASGDRAKAEIKQEMQATQEKIKIAMFARNQLEGSAGKSLYGSVKGAVGSQLNSTFSTAAAVIGVDLTVAGMMALGQEAAKSEIQLRAAFKTAGASAQDASIYIRQSASDYAKYGEAIGITSLKYEQLAKQAAIAGGFLGEQNRQLVIAAAAIEKETAGHAGGEVDAARFIKGISMGVNSEEGSSTIGQLRRSMPLLAAELAKATDKEDLFNRAIKFTNESVKSQIEWLASEGGALERESIRRQNQIEHLSKLTNSWLGSILHFANDANIALDKFFGTLDAKDAEERAIIEQNIKDLEKQKSLEDGHNKSRIQEIDHHIGVLKGQLSAADDAKKAIEAHKNSLKDDATYAEKAAQANKDFLQSLDDERSIVGVSENQWIQYELEKRKATDPERIKQLTEAQQIAIDRIKKGGASLKEYNTLLAKISHFDPSQQESGTSKSVFESAMKKLEDRMKGEQTAAELNGILLNKTKEQIEIENLNIEIKYSYEIAKAAEKNAQLKNEYLLKAAKDEKRIREINAEVVKRVEEEHRKNQEIGFRFELAAQDTYGKQRMELRKKFWEEFNTLTDPVAIARITKMANDAEKEITDAENFEKLKKQNEYQGKFLSVQMKGIENRIKSNKKDSSAEISLEDERYNKSLDIQKNYYSKAILEAKADEKLLQIAKEENREAEKNLLLEHLDNLKKITDSANQEMKDLAKQTTESVFDPITQSMNNAIATMPKFVQTLIGGLERILANKAATAIADLIFPSKKKKSDVTNTGTPEEQSGGGSWLENNIPSFGEGGYTGDGSGTFLAKLHKGEVVLPPDIVAMIKGESPHVNGASPWTEVPDSTTEKSKRWKSGDTNVDVTRKIELEKGEPDLEIDKKKLKEVTGHAIHIGIEAFDMFEKAGEHLLKVSEHLLNAPLMLIPNDVMDKNGLGEKVVADLDPRTKTMSAREMNNIINTAIPNDTKNSNGAVTVDPTATAAGTEKGVLNALKIAQSAQQGGKKSVGNAALSGIETGLALIPGWGTIASVGLGLFSSILGFADGGVYDPTKPRIVGEEGPEIDYKGAIIPLGKRKGNSNLSSHLSDMAGRAAYSGGSSAGRSNDTALLREMQSNTRAVNDLHSAIRDGSVTTRMVQLGINQGILNHSSSKY